MSTWPDVIWEPTGFISVIPELTSWNPAKETSVMFMSVVQVKMGLSQKQLATFF